MKKKENNIISLQQEHDDTAILVEKIVKDEWFSPSTILVNCLPEYSARLTQSICHQLSVYNRHELLEIIDLAMPLPDCNQVWNPLSKSYESFDTYLKNWINENVYPCNFLFICAKVDTGKALNKLRLSLKLKLENEHFRFASLYVPSDSVLIPDFHIQQYDQAMRLLHVWENPQNKNY